MINSRTPTRGATIFRLPVRWMVPAGIVLAVVTALLLRAVNASGAEPDRYATATVTRGTVTESYVGSGALTKVKQGSATFPVSATVTTVNVAIGNKVEAGDPLASIDDTDLKIAVITAKQTLAEAKVTLQHAEDAAELAPSSPSVSATATPSPSRSSAAGNRNQPGAGQTSASPSVRPTGSRPSSSRPAPTHSPTGGGSQPPTLTELEVAVREARAELAAAQLAAATALTAQQTACAPLSSTAPSSSPNPTGASLTPTATPSATETPSATATATPSATASATPSVTTTPVASVPPAELAACIAAVVKTQQAQHGVASTQAKLDPLVAALVAAATHNPSPSPNPTDQNPTTGNPTTRNPGGQPTRGTGSGTGSGSGNLAPTGNRAGSDNQSSSSGPLAGNGQGSMTVGSAEAAVTKAELALATAEKQLDAATMRAPISGTVAALPFKTGDTATTSDEVVVIGKGAVSVEMSVPETGFRKLKAGQTATVTTPGGGKATGKVTQLGLLPTASTSTSGSSTTGFPVTVVASGKDAATLPAGATATVTVALKRSANAVVVPVSAITRTGSSGTVQVLQNGTVTGKEVTLGAVGSATVEVTVGLSPGEVLVIADNTVALPTNSSNRGLRPGGARVAVQAPGGGPPPGTR